MSYTNGAGESEQFLETDHIYAKSLVIAKKSMRSLRLVSAIFLLAMLVIRGGAQEQKRTAWPVEWTDLKINSLIWINVTLKDGNPRLYLLDTGSPDMVIDAQVAKLIGLPITKQTFSTGWERDTTVSPATVGNGVVNVTALPMAVYDLGIMKSVSPHIAGILGMSLLRNLAIRFDFALKKLDVIFPGNIAGTEFEPKNAVRFHLSMESNCYFVEGTLDGKPTQFLIDTGAERSMMRLSSLAVQLKPASSVEGQPVVGFTQPTSKAAEVLRIRLLRYHKVTLGDIEWTDPVFEERLSAGNQPVVLGLDFLRRFRAILDFPGKTMYLTPDAAFQEDKQQYLGTGLIVTPPTEGKVEVVGVFKPSSAKEAGIQEGDEVLAINGQEISKLEPDQLKLLTRQPEGTEITYSIRRKGEDKPRIFKLKIKKLL